MDEKKLTNDGYQPNQKLEKGYQPSKDGKVPGFGDIKGGFQPERSEGGNPEKPPKKP